MFFLFVCDSFASCVYGLYHMFGVHCGSVSSAKIKIWTKKEKWESLWYISFYVVCVSHL